MSEFSEFSEFAAAVIFSLLWLFAGMSVEKNFVGQNFALLGSWLLGPLKPLFIREILFFRSWWVRGLRQKSVSTVLSHAKPEKDTAVRLMDPDYAGGDHIAMFNMHSLLCSNVVFHLANAATQTLILKVQSKEALSPVERALLWKSCRDSTVSQVVLSISTSGALVRDDDEELVSKEDLEKELDSLLICIREGVLANLVEAMEGEEGTRE